VVVVAVGVDGTPDEAVAGGVGGGVLKVVKGGFFNVVHFAVFVLEAGFEECGFGVIEGSLRDGVGGVWGGDNGYWHC